MNDNTITARIRAPTAADPIQTKCNLSTSICEVVDTRSELRSCAGASVWDKEEHKHESEFFRTKADEGR